MPLQKLCLWITAKCVHKRSVAWLQIFQGLWIWVCCWKHFRTLGALKWKWISSKHHKQLSKGLLTSEHLLRCLRHLTGKTRFSQTWTGICVQMCQLPIVLSLPFSVLFVINPDICFLFSLNVTSTKYENENTIHTNSSRCKEQPNCFQLK